MKIKKEPSGREDKKPEFSSGTVKVPPLPKVTPACPACGGYHDDED